MESEAVHAFKRKLAEAQQSGEPTAVEGQTKSYEIHLSEQYESFSETVENQNGNAEVSQSEVVEGQLRRETFIESAKVVAIDPNRKRDPVCNDGLLPEPEVVALDQNRERDPVCNDSLFPVPFGFPAINFPIMPTVGGVQARLAILHQDLLRQNRPQSPLNNEQVPNCGLFIKTPEVCLGGPGMPADRQRLPQFRPQMQHVGPVFGPCEPMMSPFGSKMGHDKGPLRPYGPRMEHDMGSFGYGMEPYGTRMGDDVGPCGPRMEHDMESFGSDMGPYGPRMGHDEGPYGPRMGHDEGSYGPRMGDDVGPYGPRMGDDEGPYGPRMGHDERSYGPRMGDDEGSYGSRMGDDVGPYGPRMGHDEGSYGPRMGHDEGPYGPRMGHDEGSYGTRMGDDVGPYGPRMEHDMESFGSDMGPYGPRMGHDVGLYGPRMEHDMESFGSDMGPYGPRMGHDEGPYGPMMGHDVGSFGYSTGHMRLPGPNMDTQEMEASSSSYYPPPQCKVKETEQPEVFEEKEQEEKSVKSRPVNSVLIPGTVWSVVQTNNGKHFFYNLTKRLSVWKIPEELKNRPDVEMLLSSKPVVNTEKEKQQCVQEEPPSKKFKSETEVKEDNTNEGAQNIAAGQETAVAKEVQATELRSTLSLEVRVQQFRELLAESNISAHSTWEKDLHKIVFDNRYLLLELRERKQVFNEYVEERAEEEYHEKSRKMKEKTDLYRQLLEESNLNVKSTFQHFADNYSTDKRFRMVEKMQDRVSIFLDYISELAKREKQENGLIEEKVKDSKDSFTCFKDPRWTMELSEKEKMKLYAFRVNEIRKKNREILWSILDDMNLPLEAVWSKKVRKRVQADPRYVNYTDSEDKRQDDFALFMHKKKMEAKKEGQEETELITSEAKVMLQQEKEQERPEVVEENKPEAVEEKKSEVIEDKKTEVIEEKKPEVIEGKNPEAIEEKKSEPKPEQKSVKTRAVISTSIPGTVWCVVRTNKGKHFFYNPTKHQSVWKIPEELKNRRDVEKLLAPKPEVKTEKKKQQSVQEETPSKKFKLEAKVKERSNKEITQQIVLEKKITNEVEIAETMPIISLQDRKKKFKELPAEKNVFTAPTWEKELHKVTFDKRYTLLASRERKQAFEEYVKDRTEVKHKKRWHVNKNSKLYRFMQSFDESNLNVKLEAEVKEKKAESNNEVAQQTVLEKKTTNAVKVQAAENMPVVSLEDRKKQFKEMLAEKDVKTSSTWEKEFNKVVYDKRYILLTSDERRQAFGEYVKDRAEKEKEHSELYRQLLEESDLNVKSTFRSFAMAHSHDKRFKNVVILDNRINMFQDYINELAQQEKEMNRSTREKVKYDFIKMLSETPAVAHYTLWSDVRRKLHLDPRYKAVGSESLRKNWFCAYMRVDIDAVSDDIKNKEEEQDTSLHSTSLKEKDESGTSHGETAFEDNKKLLVEKVKNDFMKMLSETPDIDQHTLWINVRRKLCLDPRYKAVSSESLRKNWFCAYMWAENDVKDDFMKMLSEIPNIDLSTSWGDVKNKVSSDPRYKAISDTRQEEWFKTYLKTVKNIKDDFMKMLNEILSNNPSTSWSYVKIVLSSDPRFKAVRDICHEELFKTYLKLVKEATSDDIQNTEEQDKSLHSSSLKEKDESGKSHGEAAIEDNKQFSVEKATSDDIKNKEEQDTSFHSSSLKEKDEFQHFPSHGEADIDDNKKILVEKVKNDFMKMLSETPDIDQHTLWRNVRRKLCLDPRYKAVGSDSVRKNWFCTYMWAENDVKGDFMKMLSEIPGINPGTSWGDVKNKVSSDSRYKAVSDTHKEEWFKTYLKTVKDVASDDIKNKEEQDKSLHSSSLKEKDESGKSHGEAAIEDNKKLLVEKIKNDFMKMLSEIPDIDQHTMWSDVRRKLFLDPRYKAVGSESLRNNWFSAYLSAENDMKGDFMKMLSEITDINLDTIWGEVKNKVSSDPRCKAVSHTRQEEWFKTYLKTVKDVKNNFMEMLSETPDIDQHMLWSDVSSKLCLDPRYTAVVNESHRSDWFYDYLRTENDVKGDFMKMLSEIIGIEPDTSWGDVKNIVSSDPRYKAVSDTRQEEWFKTYLKTIRDVKNDFMKMLSETPGISPYTLWSDVRRKLCLDPRYKVVGTESVRKNWFFAYLSAENDVKGDFMKMLSEIPDINTGTNWGDAKNKVSSNPQYKAVSDTRQEEWFKIYLKTLKDVKNNFMEMLSETPDIDQHMLRSDVRSKLCLDPRYKAVVNESHRSDWFYDYLRAEKAVKGDFMKMLSEIIGLDPGTSWDDVKNKVSSDPRYKAVSDIRQEEWFGAYLKTVTDVKNNFMKMLSETPGISPYTLWSDVRTKLCLDPRYKVVGTESVRKNWFFAYLIAENDVKGDFMKMLREMPGTSWGDVRNKVSSNPQYKAVSDTRQEEWFKIYLKTLKGATSDDIKNKEEQDKRLHLSSLKEKDKSGKSHGEAAIEDNKKLLVEKLERVTPSDSKNHCLDKNFRNPIHPFKTSYIGGSLQLQSNLMSLWVKNDFMKMLSETPDIDQHTLWSYVKRKLFLDPRYKAVSSESLRKNWFFAYLRADNDATSDDITNKEEQDKSLHSSSLKEKDESEKSHGEVDIEDLKKIPVEKVKNDFMKMLSETPDIDQHTLWSYVNQKLLLDPRYKAVDSESLRKNWFFAYLWAENDATSDDIKNKEEHDKSLHSSSLKGKDESGKRQGEAAIEDFKKILVEKATSDDIKNKEEQDKCLHSSSIEEKDEFEKHHGEAAIEDNKTFSIEKVTSVDIIKKKLQEKWLHSSSLKRINTSCLNLRNAAFEDFKQFLIEKVKDTKLSFTDFKERFLKNPKWAMELSENDKMKLFGSHVDEIHRKNREILWSILDDMNLPLEAEWSEVKKQVEADPRYVNYPDSEEKLDDEFVQYMQQKMLKAKSEFQELLSEIKFTEIKAMLQQKSITVLNAPYHIRKDKRYTALGRKEREEMFVAYINELKEKNQTPR